MKYQDCFLQVKTKGFVCSIADTDACQDMQIERVMLHMTVSSACGRPQLEYRAGKRLLLNLQAAFARGSLAAPCTLNRCEAVLSTQEVCTMVLVAGCPTFTPACVTFTLI